MRGTIELLATRARLSQAVPARPNGYRGFGNHLLDACPLHVSNALQDRHRYAGCAKRNQQSPTRAAVQWVGRGRNPSARWTARLQDVTDAYALLTGGTGGRSATAPTAS